ncbi:MAG: GtrA family protein [Clostridia bacterium]|nr:GtrA family protein [Clostridia bacterium]
MTEKRKELLRTVKFTLFSISAGVIETVSDILFNEVFHLGYWVSYGIALALSVLWNFTLNRNITFKSANNVPIAMLKVAAYYAVFAPASIWWTDYFTYTKGINAYIVLAATMIINFVTEYLYQRFFVFGKSIDTAVTKQNKDSIKAQNAR